VEEGDLMRALALTVGAAVALAGAARMTAAPAGAAPAPPPIASDAVPPPEAFRVLAEEPPSGRRVTAYLQSQLGRAHAQDEARRARWSSRVQSEADLLKLQAETRAKALALIGGLPAEKTPLRARVTGIVPMDGYRIERLVFESQPGLFVTALLYVPDAPVGPRPAVLLPCGHSPVGKAYANYQEIGGRLAKRGYVVLSWDPVGQGERSQFWDAARKRSRFNLVCGEHAVLGNLATLAGTSLVRYEVWDGIRAVDYLLTRPEVDGKRLSITGTSGGGFQSTWIGALDERIGVVAPSCFVTSLPLRMANRIFEDPDSDPEQDPPGLVSEGIDHAGLLLLAYPRPVHVASAIRDFVPIEGARRTVAEIRALYERFGHGDRVGFAQGDHEHRYSDQNQQMAFDFLDRWNGAGTHEGLFSVRPLPPETLQVTPTGQVRVDLGGRSLADVIREDFHARPAAPSDVRSLYAAAPGASPGPVTAERVGSAAFGDATIDRWLVRQPGRLAMPLVHVRGRGASTGRTVLLLSLAGKIGPSDWPSVRRHLSRGDAVAGLDLRGTGEDRLRYRAVSVDDPAIAPADEAAAYFDPLSGVFANHAYNGLLTGRPYLFEAIDDVAAAASFCRETLGAKRLAVAGLGDATLLAAAASRVLDLQSANDPAAAVFSWRGAVEEGRERWPIQYLFPGGASLDDGHGRLR
jgi:dienelactone hydrolase